MSQESWKIKIEKIKVHIKKWTEQQRGGGGGGGVGGGGAQCAEPVNSTPHRMFVTGVPHITNFGQVVPLSSR